MQDMAAKREGRSERTPVTRPADARSETPTDQVSELWRLLGVTSEKGADATSADPPSSWSVPASAVSTGTVTAPGAGGWKVEPLPTAAEGGILAMFTAAPDIADELAPPPPPDPAAVSTLVPETLRGADTLESLLAGPSVAPPVERDVAPESGPPSLDTFASDPVAPLLGSQPPSWGPYAGDSPAQSGRARLAEMLDDLPDEPTQRITADDVHVDRPVIAPAAIWFWGDDDIYPGRTSSATRSETTAARRKKAADGLLVGAPAATDGADLKSGKARWLRLR
jgi:hypothetical protein